MSKKNLMFPCVSSFRGLFTENGQPDLEVVLLQEGSRACGTSEEGTYRYVDVRI